MIPVSARETLRKPTAFRLDTNLVARLRVLAKEDNRSLNNYVESILMRAAYSEPNETTLSAMREAEENNNLEDFNFDAFNEYVESLK